MKPLSNAMACGPKRPEAHLALANEWKDVPEGTPVVVTKDDGQEFLTKTRSIPWMLGASSQSPGHTAVIMVEGITGGYGLWRIRKATDADKDLPGKLALKLHGGKPITLSDLKPGE